MEESHREVLDCLAILCQNIFRSDRADTCELYHACVESLQRKIWRSLSGRDEDLVVGYGITYTNRRLFLSLATLPVGSEAAATRLIRIMRVYVYTAKIRAPMRAVRRNCTNKVKCGVWPPHFGSGLGVPCSVWKWFADQDNFTICASGHQLHILLTEHGTESRFRRSPSRPS